MLRFSACAYVGQSFTMLLQCVVQHGSDATVRHDPPPAIRLLPDVDSWTVKEVPGGEQGDCWARIDGIISRNSAMT